MLAANLQYNDAAFVCLTHGIAQQNDLAGILKLDEECSALKAPEELRAASKKLGIRLLKIFKRHQAFTLINEYENCIHRKEAAGHYCIVYGLYSAAFALNLADSLTAFYYNAAVGMITNAVKLVPLGQLEGQDILYRSQALIQKLVPATMELDRHLVGRSNPGFDIACMQHERLYSRLYMS